MSKHTPGQWYVDEHPAGLRVLTDDARSTIICGHIGPTSNESAQADARLIAAAPNMLEALQSCVMVMERDLGGLKLIQPELEEARAAIAKAEGT